MERNWCLQPRSRSSWGTSGWPPKSDSRNLRERWRAFGAAGSITAQSMNIFVLNLQHCSQIPPRRISSCTSISLGQTHLVTTVQEHSSLRSHSHPFPSPISLQLRWQAVGEYPRCQVSRHLGLWHESRLPIQRYSDGKRGTDFAPSLIPIIAVR